MKLQALSRRSKPREPWHRSAVGGMWDEIGPMQRDFLVSEGLKPHHALLDIGCGSLRGGVHAIRYLDPGRYYGVDRDGELLRCAREIELPAHGIVEKEPHLLRNEEFEFWRFDTSFDFALAQSVFTHLPFNSITRCLAEVARVLKPGGRCFATFFDQPDAQVDCPARSQQPAFQQRRGERPQHPADDERAHHHGAGQLRALVVVDVPDDRGRRHQEAAQQYHRRQ